mmetsp:Transcript_18186/g.30974  ORF Transcript_18186/g.30974 Transcript_18186/m.30974 type:complete len:84 (-) Transcript_18186:167-418(-)
MYGEMRQLKYVHQLEILLEKFVPNSMMAEKAFKAISEQRVQHVLQCINLMTVTNNTSYTGKDDYTSISGLLVEQTSFSDIKLP